MGLNKATVHPADGKRQYLQLRLIPDRVAGLCLTCGARTNRPHDHTIKAVLLPSGASAIRLSRGKFALVDREDVERVSAAGPWSAMWNGRLWYAVSSSAGYLHRFVLGVSDAVLVDHCNLDTLDCRKQNLRRASFSQNVCNRRKKHYAAGVSSRFKGVDSHEGKWRAQIAKDGLRMHLGSFDSEEAAALAYDAAARSLHGEFARVNFPHPGESPAMRIEVRDLSHLKHMPEGRYPMVDPHVEAAVTAASRWRQP